MVTGSNSPSGFCPNFGRPFSFFWKGHITRLKRWVSIDDVFYLKELVLFTIKISAPFLVEPKPHESLFTSFRVIVFNEIWVFMRLFSNSFCLSFVEKKNHRCSHVRLFCNFEHERFNSVDLQNYSIKDKRTEYYTKTVVCYLTYFQFVWVQKKYFRDFEPSVPRQLASYVTPFSKK
jgi:hypothetical protein